jgi:hypothetical protein
MGHDFKHAHAAESDHLKPNISPLSKSAFDEPDGLGRTLHLTI